MGGNDGQVRESASNFIKQQRMLATHREISGVINAGVQGHQQVFLHGLSVNRVQFFVVDGHAKKGWF